MQNLSSLRKPSCERVDDCIEISRECTEEVVLNCSAIQRRVEPEDKSDLWNFKVRFTSLTPLPSALPQQHILQAKNCTHKKTRDLKSERDWGKRRRKILGEILELKKMRLSLWMENAIRIHFSWCYSPLIWRLKNFQPRLRRWCWYDENSLCFPYSSPSSQFFLCHCQAGSLATDVISSHFKRQQSDIATFPCHFMLPHCCSRPFSFISFSFVAVVVSLAGGKCF